MTKTVNGRILLGWMGKDEALRVLLQEAVFDEPLDEAGALGLWECYKAKVAALGPRDCAVPPWTKLNLKEKRAGEKLIKKFQKRGAYNTKRTVKIDPMGLVVHQLQIVEDRADLYRDKMRVENQKIRTCLASAKDNYQLPYHQVGGTITIDIPHREFEISIGLRRNIEISENAQHVAVSAFDGRLLLWAGYHRSYALKLVSQEYPEEIERLLLAILTIDADLFLGPRSVFPDKRDMVRGPCPALFRDFFDPDLCMRLKLRKRRCEIQLNTVNFHVTKAWLDDDT